MGTELRIDRIACDGAGLCAELLPERIGLDEWGYPIIAAGPIPDALLTHARRAVETCPVLALRLVEVSAVRRQARAVPGSTFAPQRTIATRSPASGR